MAFYLFCRGGGPGLPDDIDLDLSGISHLIFYPLGYVMGKDDHIILADL